MIVIKYTTLTILFFVSFIQSPFSQCLPQEMVPNGQLRCMNRDNGHCRECVPDKVCPRRSILISSTPPKQELIMVTDKMMVFTEIFKSLSNEEAALVALKYDIGKCRVGEDARPTYLINGKVTSESFILEEHKAMTLGAYHSLKSFLSYFGQRVKQIAKDKRCQVGEEVYQWYYYSQKRVDMVIRQRAEHQKVQQAIAEGYSEDVFTEFFWDYLKSD